LSDNKPYHPIGVFDSGYGGLTVFKEIVKDLPHHDFLYLGDNARSPYGSRSFDAVYHYTLECVEWFFKQGCPLVVLACNTASAKALRTIQQNDLHKFGADKRLLGVIRPTSEVIGKLSKTKHIGIFATKGTVNSESYPIEIAKYWPELIVSQVACPMWVPLIENDEINNNGADFFIKKQVDVLLDLDTSIDTILLGCTHYPLIADKIQKCLPDSIQVFDQGNIVADSLVDYLNRHEEMNNQISKNSKIDFYTTDDVATFNEQGSKFYGKDVHSKHVDLLIALK
jgi:glutamate racemase